jgi:hypothetical protein
VLTTSLSVAASGVLCASLASALITTSSTTTGRSSSASFGALSSLSGVSPTSSVGALGRGSSVPRAQPARQVRRQRARARASVVGVMALDATPLAICVKVVAPPAF